MSPKKLTLLSRRSMHGDGYFRTFVQDKMELKYAIVYDLKSKHESRMARDLYTILKSHGHRVSKLRIKPTLSVEAFDHIIIGGSMIKGKISPVMDEFIWRNEEVLLEKRVSLFLCLENIDGDVHAQFQSAFPQWLRRHALARAICCKAKISEDWGTADRLIVGSESINPAPGNVGDTFINEFYETIVT